MSKDNPIIPRKSVIPVAARRTDDRDSLIDAGTQSVPSAPQPYVVFIQAPSPALPATAPPVPAASPQNVSSPSAVHHFHTTHHAVTTTTNHYHPSTRRDRHSGQSTLGLASLALGIIACVVCWVPVVGLAAVPVGAIGATLGVMGIFLSTLFRRSSAALPAGGLFVCLLAAGVSVASTGSLVYWRTRMEHAIPKSIAQQIEHPFTAPSVVKPPAHPTPTPLPTNPAILAASQRLKLAQQSCDERTKNSDEYRLALATQADARAAALSLNGKPLGSGDRIDAQSRVIAADNALSAIVEQARRDDPDIQAAGRDLVTARHASGNP